MLEPDRRGMRGCIGRLKKMEHPVERRRLTWKPKSPVLDVKCTAKLLIVYVTTENVLKDPKFLNISVAQLLFHNCNTYVFVYHFYNHNNSNITLNEPFPRCNVIAYLLANIKGQLPNVSYHISGCQFDTGSAI